MSIVTNMETQETLMLYAANLRIQSLYLSNKFFPILLLLLLLLLLIIIIIIIIINLFTVSRNK